MPTFLRAFYKCNDIVIKDKKLYWKVTEGLIGHKLSHAVTKGGDTIVPQGRKITASVYKELQKAKIEQVEVAANDLEGASVAADVIDMETGEVLIEANHPLTTTSVGKFIESHITALAVSTVGRHRQDAKDCGRSQTSASSGFLPQSFFSVMGCVRLARKSRQRQ